MPFYEYRCGNGHGKEVRLSFGDAALPQVCVCGDTMQRKISVPSFAMRPTGVGMALNTLNDKQNGMPDKWWKRGAEKHAAAGL